MAPSRTGGHGGEDSWSWPACWPASRGRWTRNCWRETNIGAAENRILKANLKGRAKLSDAGRATLGEIGHRLGRKVLGDAATVAQPDTILGWHRKLVARKFDGSKTGQVLADPGSSERSRLLLGSSTPTRSLSL
jgi:hypothetical protein